MRWQCDSKGNITLSYCGNLLHHQLFPLPCIIACASYLKVHFHEVFRLFFLPTVSLCVCVGMRACACLCAVCLWEWEHRLEFSHWRCQLAFGDGKRAWVGSAVTSRSSRTSLPPSHFVSRYFLSSSPLRICPFFYHPIPCSIPASPLLISSVIVLYCPPFPLLPPFCLCSCFVILCGNPAVLL